MASEDPYMGLMVMCPNTFGHIVYLSMATETALLFGEGQFIIFFNEKFSESGFQSSRTLLGCTEKVEVTAYMDITCVVLVHSTI